MTDSPWLEKAKAQLRRRDDPLDVLRDVESLLEWAAARADSAIDMATIQSILNGQPVDPELKRRIALRKIAARRQR